MRLISSSSASISSSRRSDLLLGVASALRTLFSAFSTDSFPLSATVLLHHATRSRLRLFSCVRKCRLKHIADRLPGAAVELDQPQLLDRLEIPRPRIDLDARQQRGSLVVVECGRLLHHVLA